MPTPRYQVHQPDPTKRQADMKTVSDRIEELDCLAANKPAELLVSLRFSVDLLRATKGSTREMRPRA